MLILACNGVFSCWFAGPTIIFAGEAWFGCQSRNSQVIMSSNSSSSSAFSVLNARLLGAGKVNTSALDAVSTQSTSEGNNTNSQACNFDGSSLIMCDFILGNAILRAQKNSTLYDANKLAADPLIAPKKIMPKTVGKGWFDMEVSN